MALLRSKFRTGLDNLTVDESEVTTIKLSPPFPNKPNLWVLYFYGRNDKAIRTWYYDSQTKRQKDLDHVLKQCPKLKLA